MPLQRLKARLLNDLCHVDVFEQGPPHQARAWQSVSPSTCRIRRLFSLLSRQLRFTLNSEQIHLSRYALSRLCNKAYNHNVLSTGSERSCLCSLPLNESPHTPRAQSQLLVLLLTLSLHSLSTRPRLGRKSNSHSNVFVSPRKYKCHAHPRFPSTPPSIH